MTHGQPGDNANHKVERSEGQSDRAERRAGQKAGSEASNNMEYHSKSIVEGIAKKRLDRKSGITDKFNENLENGKKVASADELLPLEKSNKAKSYKPDKTQSPGRQQILEAPPHRAEVEAKQNLDRAKEAAGKALQTIFSGGLYENGNVPKVMRDGPSPGEIAETRFVQAGTPLEIRGHVYALNELTAQSSERASDEREKKQKDNPMAGVPTILGRDGVRRLDGHFQPESKGQEPELADVIGAIGKALEPVTNAISHFNSDSAKALHNIVEQGKEAVGLNPPHTPKPIHAATGDGGTLPKSIQNPGDAAHLGIGATVGFTKAVSEMMPGLTPRGAIEGSTQAVKQVAALAHEHGQHETNMHRNPIGTMLQDAVTAVKMYNGALDWANSRSQTENFAERGHDIGKASPDVMMASEIIFIARSGHLITPRDAVKLQLETKTPEELERLGIKRTMSDQIKPEDMVNPIDRNATPQEKIRQLQELSAENAPLVEDFAKHIDEKFGTKSSEAHLKDPADIMLKSVRPEVKEKYPWFEIEHVRDSLRFKTPVDDLSVLPSIAKELKESKFEIINPDVDKLLIPKGRGWRMAAFDLRAPNGQIIEYQILSKEMNEAGKIEHSTYKGVREKDVKKMTSEEAAAKVNADKKAVELYRAAHRNYLKRTGQTDETIREAIEKTRRILEEKR